MIERVTRASARRPGRVLALSTLLVALLATGLPSITFSDDPLAAMPRGNVHTQATQELIERFPGSSYTAAAYVTVDPTRWAPLDERLPFRTRTSDDQTVPLGTGPGDVYATVNPLLAEATQGSLRGVAHVYPGPENITDEVYMRAQEEMFLFLQERVDGLAWGITLPSQVKLVNYTNTGVPNPVPGQDALQAPDADAFRLPGTDADGARQFQTAWQTYFASSPDSVRTITSSDWRSARLAFLFQPGDRRLDEVGSDFYAAVDAYREELARCTPGASGCSLEWPAFHPDDVLVDPRTPVAAASYLTKTTLHDLRVLAPVAALLVALCLAFSFRSTGTLLALLIPMGLAGVGVLGIFGHLSLPIHSVSLLVFPVLLGNGIDFAIHMASAYHHARRSGLGVEDAAGAAGRRAGTPLAIATATTVVGMLLLVFAPNRLLSQLGLAILLGMVLLLALSLTALPAALAFTRTAAERRRRASTLRHTARLLHRHRVAGITSIVVLAAAGAVASAQLGTLIIGTPATYFPPGDQQREDFEQSNRQYFQGNEDLVTNALVVRGDLATPQAMDLLLRLQEGLKELDFVRQESTVSIRFAMDAWIQVREGTAGAPLVIAQETVRPGSTFPQDTEGVRVLLDEMFATPLATYASFFVNQPGAGRTAEYDIGIVLVEVYQAATYEELEEQWMTLLAKVDEIEAAGEPSGLEFAITGQTAVSYLFTKEEMPYLKVAGILGIAATGLVVFAVRRDLRDALTVAMVVACATGLWLGSLWVLDIPISIALVVPLVVITAIGSDYALHLRCSLRDAPERAWDLVGRAVLYAAVTDLAAFLVFTQMRYGVLAQATLATAAAVTCCMVTTAVLVPALARRHEVEGHSRTSPMLPARPVRSTGAAGTERSQ